MGFSTLSLGFRPGCRPLKRKRKRHMRLVLLFAAFILSQQGHCAEIYKWIDANGDVQYGNVPPGEANSESMKIDQPALQHSKPVQNTYRENKKLSSEGTGDDSDERIIKAHEEVRDIQKANYDPEKCALARARAETIKKRDPLLYSTDVNYFDSTQKISLYCHK